MKVNWKLGNRYLIAILILFFSCSLDAQRNYFEHLEMEYNDTSVVVNKVKIPYNFYKMMYLNDTSKEKLCVNEFYYGHYSKMHCNCKWQQDNATLMGVATTSRKIWILTLFRRGAINKCYIYTYDSKNRIFGVLILKEQYKGSPGKLTKEIVDSYEFMPFSIFRNQKIEVCDLSYPYNK